MLPSLPCNSFFSSPQSSQSQQDQSQGWGSLTGRCSVVDLQWDALAQTQGDLEFINTHKTPVYCCLGSCLHL